MFLTKVLILTVSVGYIAAFPSGAPANICGRYVPGGHRNMGTPVANGPRTGPYSVTVTPAGNRQYTVTLRSTTNQPFRGYTIQAMQSWKQLPDGPSDILGSFQPDFASGQSQMRMCGARGGSNVLTHTSKTDKNQISATWTAPMNLPDPSVKFVATVVQDFDNFYVVHSDPINIDGAGSQGSQNGGMGNGATGTTSFPSGFTATNSVNGLQTIVGFGSGGMSGISPTTDPMLMTTGAVPAFTSFTSNLDVNIHRGSNGKRPPPPIVLPNGHVSLHNSNKDISSSTRVNSNSNSSSRSTSGSDRSNSRSRTSMSVNRFLNDRNEINSIPIPSTALPATVTNPTSSFLDMTSSTGARSSSVRRTSSSNRDVASRSRPQDTVVQTIASFEPRASGVPINMNGFRSEDTSVTISGDIEQLNGGRTTLTRLIESLIESNAVNGTVKKRFPNIPNRSSVSTSSISRFSNRRTVSNRLAKPTMVSRLPDRSISSVDRSVQIIEMPILPEGQRAALLNITRGVRSSPGDTPDSISGPPVELRETRVSRDGNVLRVRVGSTGITGQGGFGGQGQTGVSSGSFGGTTTGFGGRQAGGFQNTGRFGQQGLGGRMPGFTGGARFGQAGGFGRPGFTGRGGGAFGGTPFSGAGGMGSFGGMGTGMFGGQAGGVGSGFGGGFGQGGPGGAAGGQGGFGGPGGMGGGASRPFGGGVGGPFGGGAGGAFGGGAGGQFGGGAGGPFGGGAGGQFGGGAGGPFGGGAGGPFGGGAGGPFGGGAGGPFGGGAGGAFGGGAGGAFGGGAGGPFGGGAGGPFGGGAGGMGGGPFGGAGGGMFGAGGGAGAFGGRPGGGQGFGGGMQFGGNGGAGMFGGQGPAGGGGSPFGQFSGANGAGGQFGGGTTGGQFGTAGAGGFGAGTNGQGTAAGTGVSGGFVAPTAGQGGATFGTQTFGATTGTGGGQTGLGSFAFGG